MPDRDPRCVHIASTRTEAVVTATALMGRGIPARMKDAAAPAGSLDGIASLLGDSSPQGVEIWVDDPEHAEDAKQLLLEMKADLSQLVEERNHRGPVEMECDKCGRKLKFDAADWGTVQECPKCGNFMDVGEVDNSMEWDTAEIDENDPELQ